MKLLSSVVAGALVALPLFCQSANAGSSSPHRTDHRITAASIGVGAATTAGFFALRDWRLNNNNSRLHGFTGTGAAVVTTMGCLALSPIVGTVMVGRELTFREAYALTADCVVPFVGAWLVNRPSTRIPNGSPRRRRRSAASSAGDRERRADIDARRIAGRNGSGGRDRDRTCDPYHVKVVLFR